MKTFFIVLLGSMALIGSVGCKQEWTSYEEWQVASKRPIMITDHMESTQRIDTLFWVRNAPSEHWRFFDIKAFPNYEKGFEYVVRVEIHNRKEPQYKITFQTALFDQILSKTPTESEGISYDTIFAVSRPE